MPRTTPPAPYEPEGFVANVTFALAFAHVDEVIDGIKAHPSAPVRG